MEEAAIWQNAGMKADREWAQGTEVHCLNPTSPWRTECAWMDVNQKNGQPIKAMSQGHVSSLRQTKVQGVDTRFKGGSRLSSPGRPKSQIMKTRSQPKVQRVEKNIEELSTEVGLDCRMYRLRVSSWRERSSNNENAD